MKHEYLAAKVVSLGGSAGAGFAAMQGTASEVLTGIVGHGGLLDVTTLFWALMGSGVSLVAASASERDDEPLTRFWRRAALGFSMFIVGGIAGVAMGPAYSRLPMLDAASGAFLAGLTGWGVVLFVRRPDTIRAIGEWIVRQFQGGAK